MALQTKVDANGKEYTELWSGAPSAPVLSLTVDENGITLGENKVINGQISSAGENADFLTVTAATSVQTPTSKVGNADAATARTGGIVRAPDVSGATTNVAGADLKVGGGLGHGNGTPGNVLLQTSSAAASGDNPQTRATIATVSPAGLSLAASKVLQSPSVAAGDADAAITARTGGTVRASDVATGGAGNVAGADLTVRPGKGTGTGTPGKVIVQAAPVAGAGDNTQTPQTVFDVAATTITLADAVNIAVNTTTGTKIGTGATQKLGFYGVTPVVQPALVADPAGGGTVDAEARTAIASVIDKLIELGLMAAA